MNNLNSLILLGGCFWGLEYALREVSGVSTEVGYAGGIGEKLIPTYYNLESTGNSEAVRVQFASESGSLLDVLRIFRNHSIEDPSPPTKVRYRRAILCPDAVSLECVRRMTADFENEFSLEIETIFVRAEEVHQQHYRRMIDD